VNYIPALLHKGLELASDFLSYIREDSNSSAKTEAAAAKASAEASEKMVTAINDVYLRLDDAVKNIVDQISDKIEQEQLEQLTSLVKSVHFAMEFGDKAMLLQTVGHIITQIEYAKNRIHEGKSEWLGPWLMAESIRIVALREISTNQKALDAVARAAYAFRLNILDFAGSYLLQSRHIPWVKISEFVEGKNEDVILLISTASSQLEDDPEAVSEQRSGVFAKGDGTRSEKKIDPASAVKTVLNLAGAWPFPGGSRP